MFKIEGEYYPVKAKIESIGTLSSHADQNDILKWVEKLEKCPEKVFITHGEPQAANALRIKLKDTYDWYTIEIPQLFDLFDL